MVEVLNHNVLDGPMRSEENAVGNDEFIQNDVVSKQLDEHEETKHQTQVLSTILNRDTTLLNQENVDMKQKFVQLWDVVKENIKSNHDFLNISTMLKNYNPEQNMNYRDRFNGLWWMIEKKIKVQEDFEKLEHLLDLFKSEENDKNMDTSIFNSTLDMTKGVRRKRFYFEK
jgi:hypothetical protein